MAISNLYKQIINRMNRRSNKVQLGTVLQTAENAIDAVEAQLNSKTIVHSSIVTTSGGAAGEDINITGVLATDQCLVTLSDSGTNDVTIVTAVCAEDKVTVTYSGDPAADTILNVLVIR